MPFRIILLMLSCATVISCDRQKKPITIGTVETIHSNLLDEDRKILVHVPDENPPDSVKYPVLYLMDGDAHFKSVVGLMHQMSSVNGNSVCPKMIIVGIPNTQRMRDLTPTRAEMKDANDESTPKSGGGEAFTNFIATELIPFIEKNYPATNQRTLVGHSLGGLMVINTLFNHTELFDKYVAIDPSLWWNDQRSLREYEKRIATNDLRGKSLYIGIANTINMDTLDALQDTTEATRHYRSIIDFTNALRKHVTNGLDWQAKYYPDDQHSSVPMISEYDAFHFLYRKIPIRMDLAQLRRFEGKYTGNFSGQDLFLDVVAKDDFLAVTESWRNRQMEFLPVGEKEFYTFREKFSLQFRTDVKGKVVDLVAWGRDVWKKVD